MLKSIKTLLVATLLAFVSFGAFAQTIPDSYTTSNNLVINVASDRSFACKTGAQGQYIERVYSAGSVSLPNAFLDAGGAVCAKMKLGQVNKIQVGVTERFLNARAIDYARCNNGSSQVIFFGGNEDFIGDGCAVHAAWKARTPQ